MDPSCFPWHPASSSPASCKPLVDPFPHHPDVFSALPSRWDSCRKSPARTWTLSAPVPCFDSVMESDIDKLFTLPDEHWSPPVLSMDAASKGTGLFSVHDANLAASHCLAGFSTDPGFAERAAKFSCFGNPCAQPELAQLPYALQDGCNAGERSTSCASDKLKMARLSSDHRTPRCSAPNSPVMAADSGDSRKASEIFTLKSVQEPSDEPKLPKYQDRRSGRISPFKKNDSDEVDGCSGLEVSSSCERAGCETASQSLMENRGKKRKPGCKERSKDAVGITNSGEVKDLAVDEGKGQNHKSGEDQAPKMEHSISGNSDDSTPKSLKGSSIKTSEAAKPDYIHVRARRGQATDSHSLAERVRREKISERMKYLQDLVPGCSKVTGKAVMLDEIINYVQSLQRQVEFLSMKLAAMNPRLEFNLDSLFGKETTHSRVVAPSLHFAQENNNSYPSLHQQQQQAPVQAGASCPPVDFHSLGTDASRTISNPQASMDTYGDSVLQISQAWYEELHSVSQMGISQGTRTPLTSPGLQGRLYPGQMKVEL